MTLPVCCTHQEGETLASFTSRLAAANGLTATEFCKDLGLSFSAVILGDTNSLAKIADLSGADAQVLAAWSPQKTEERRTDLRGHSFLSKTLRTAQVRGCLHCLAEDAARNPKQPELELALRGAWMVPHMQICLRHGTPLMPLWEHAQPTQRYDSALNFRDTWSKLEATTNPLKPVAPSRFDLWIADRLVGNLQNTWLDNHPLQAASSFCFALGTAIGRVKPIKNQRDAYARGFDVARGGPETIRCALESLQHLPLGPQAGAKKVFPKLYERLAYDTADDPEYDVYRDILRAHMTATWPLEAGQDILGASLKRRRLHSVRTAAKAYKIDPRRLRKMLAAAGVVPAAGAQGARADTWDVFPAEDMHARLGQFSRLCDAKEFAASLNMSRSQFNLLVRDGVLRPCLPNADVKTIWDPEDGATFLASVFEHARSLKHVDAPWVHISKSAQRLKISPAPIIRAIQTGRFDHLGCSAQHTGYAALFVDHDEVSSFLKAQKNKAG